jgi:lipid kinase YegS
MPRAEEKKPQNWRVRILLHGKAASRPDIREAVKKARDSGNHIEVRVTWEAGDTQRLVREAVAEGIETVVAGGGDGTINEVVTGLFQTTRSIDERPSLGILPLGTANDFARSCHIPLDPASALGLVVSSAPSPMDIVRVGDRFLINVATGGFGPKITVETSEDLKKVLGGAAYFVTGVTKLKTLAAEKARFRGPGFEWSGAYPILAIGNARQAGGGNVLCPDALIDDGLMDVRILPYIPEAERNQAIQELLSEGEGAIEKRVVQARIPWVEIEADEPLHINLDGEPMNEKRYRFEIDAGSLRLHLPADAPVVTKK